MSQPHRRKSGTVMQLAPEDRKILKNIADNLEQISVNLEQIWSKI